MKKTIGLIICLMLVAAAADMAPAKSYNGRKILFIDSYHEGYAWSDGIIKGVQQGLRDSGVELEIFRMDTKRNTDEAFKKKAARDARKKIAEIKPDVVIAADDNASKYLIQPYFRDAALPIVFCGVNWDAAVYGYPYSNVTGMVEVAPVPLLIDQMELWARGNRIGFLAPDILTARKEAENYEKVYGMALNTYFAKNFADWKRGFDKMQDEVDMLIIDSDGGLYTEHTLEMVEFVESNTRIPTGTCYDFMVSYALVGVIKVAEEQGKWSAETALEILDGKSPADIPIIRNKKAKLVFNNKLGQAMRVDVARFPRLR